MPELPDILIYIEHLHKRLLDQRLENIRINTPFLLRTAEPPLTCLLGQTIIGIERLGKRFVFVFPDEFYLVLHLMIAGRLPWREANCKIPGPIGLADRSLSLLLKKDWPRTLEDLEECRPIKNSSTTPSTVPEHPKNHRRPSGDTQQAAELKHGARDHPESFKISLLLSA